MPRDILYGWQIPESRKDFDWMDDEHFDMAEFFRYKGRVYALVEFTRSNAFPGFDGYASDSYFSGVLVRVVDDGESVVVGRYYA